MKKFFENIGFYAVFIIISALVFVALFIPLYAVGFRWWTAAIISLAILIVLRLIFYGAKPLFKNKK
jgi:hypothetical protein